MVWHSRVKSRSDRGEHHHENQAPEGGFGRSCRRGSGCRGSRVSGALEKPARGSIYAWHFVWRGRRCRGHAVFGIQLPVIGSFTLPFLSVAAAVIVIFWFCFCAARTPFVDPVRFDFNRDHLQFVFGCAYFSHDRFDRR